MRLLATVMASLALGPAVARASTPPVGGAMELRAPSSTWAPVDVVHDTRVTLIRDGKLTSLAEVGGAGDTRGVLLAREPLGPDSPGLFGRTNEFGFPISMLPVGGLRIEANEAGDTAWTTLPAGRYRLISFAGPGPVEAKVRLGDVPGSSSLVAAEALAAQTPDIARRDTWPAANMAVLGATATLPGPGLITFSLYAHTNENPSAAQRVESCTYAPGSDPDAEDAFGYGCPGGGDSSEFLHPPSPGFFPVGTGTGMTELYAAGGTWGVGGNVEIVGPPPEIVASALFLPHTGTPLPQPSAPPAPAPAEPVQPAPALRITRATAPRGRISAWVLCAAPIACHGALVARKGRRVIARRPFALPAGTAKEIRLRARLGRARRVTLVATARGGMRAARSLRVRR